MKKTTLVATLATRPSSSGEQLLALPSEVEWLEVRADLVGDLAADWLQEHFSGRLIYTLRSRAEGGAFSGSAAERRERLLKAARDYDLVDLEGARDLSPQLLAELPPAKRLVSWHGAAANAHELKSRFEQLSSAEARLYRLVTSAAKAGDEIGPLALLKSLGRSDTIAYSSGRIGFWSRVVAPHLGSPMVFGAVEGGGGVEGEPSISRLIDDYGLPALAPLKEIYGIVGSPVGHSLSPYLHNAAYRELEHPAMFFPFHADSFSDFWQEVVSSRTLASLGLSIRGLTVASPHKESAIALAGTISQMVQRAGATNIFVRHNGTWNADTTDPEGVVQALKERCIRIEGKRAAVIGCGGAGRAISAALDQAGASVTMVNRGLERGERAVELLGLPFVPLSEFNVEGYSILVNATPVGRDDGEMPCDVEGLSEDAVVIDLVYGKQPTPLAERTLALGRSLIDGREVLLTQVLRQFRLMISREMPIALARRKLGYEDALTGLATVV
jgi:3-dehydroquinate dehydratase/shikimate dehydrogenase